MQKAQRFDVYNIDDKTTNIEQNPEGYLKITGTILTMTGTFKNSIIFASRKIVKILLHTQEHN